MKIGMIGEGSIGRYVSVRAVDSGHASSAVLLRPERHPSRARGPSGTFYVASVKDLSSDIDYMTDCAGHAALSSFGPDILRRGADLTTVSQGALADADLHRSLEQARAATPATHCGAPT